MTNKSDLRIKFAYSEKEYNAYATLFLFKLVKVAITRLQNVVIKVLN